MDNVSCGIRVNFNSLAPRGGRSCQVSVSVPHINHFNSLAPRGGDPPMPVDTLPIMIFQLTRPAGGAIHGVLNYSKLIDDFNSLAPRGGRSVIDDKQNVLRDDFNSLAPRGGDPRQLFGRENFFYISTHSPRGGAIPAMVTVAVLALGFQLTRPAGGRSICLLL